MRSGGRPAGSSRGLRLDPFALPACYAASDAAADKQVRHVELHRLRVVVRRSLAGMRMALNLPVSAFAGVSLKLARDAAGATATVTLEHKDPSLALPLFVSAEADEAIVEWRVWANVLGLPMLVAEAGGAMLHCVPHLGAVAVAAVKPRRRRCNVLAKRRPSILMRRIVRRLPGATAIHRGEREITARG
jgi:hypothetical protein